MPYPKASRKESDDIVMDLCISGNDKVDETEPVDKRIRYQPDFEDISSDEEFPWWHRGNTNMRSFSQNRKFLDFAQNVWVFRNFTPANTDVVECLPPMNYGQETLKRLSFNESTYVSL